MQMNIIASCNPTPIEGCEDMSNYAKMKIELVKMAYPDGDSTEKANIIHDIMIMDSKAKSTLKVRSNV